MERKDLTGCRFIGSNSKEHLILAGCESKEVVFEECDSVDTILEFCCDAKLVDGKLYGTNHTAYAVTKNEFFKTIHSIAEGSKADVDTLTSELRKKYYKIPTAFLKLIVDIWFKGEK